MKHWFVAGTPTICDCGRTGYVITDHRGFLYGCRPTHPAAMTFARQKAAKYAAWEASR